MVSPKISASSSNLPLSSNPSSPGNPPPSSNPPPPSSSSNPPPSDTPPQRSNPLSNHHPPANNPQSSSHPPSSFPSSDARGSQEPSAERADDAKEGRTRRGFGVLKRSQSTSSPDNKQGQRHPSHNPQPQLGYPWIMDIPVTWSWNSLTHTWSSVGGVDPDSQGWWGGFFDRRRNSYDPWGPPLTPPPGAPGPALPWWHGTNKILFYNKHEPYYGFTNFSNHPVMYERKKYPTSEHLFQSFKFTHKPKLAEHIRTCSSRPSVAFAEARRFAPEIRQDWGDEKIKAMEITLYHKFTQHKDLKRQLLGTGEKELVENSDKDSYWGCGPDGKGKNELGKALERLRDRLREERR